MTWGDPTAWLEGASDLGLTVWLVYGHLAAWVGWFNRTHSFDIPRRWIHLTELLQVGGAVILLCLFAISRQTAAPLGSLEYWRQFLAAPWFLGYFAFASVAATWTTARWLRRRWRGSHLDVLLANNTRHWNIRDQLAELPVQDFTARCLTWLPFNEMFDLMVTTKTLRLPSLPPELDGLTITHLSDLHYTGKVTLPFFLEVMHQAASLHGDLIAVTGDILENEDCWDWLAPTLGNLSAPCGRYFVLGNHDKRLPNPDHLRERLQQLGYCDVGRKPVVAEIRGCRVLLAGNEWPWFGPPAEFAAEPESFPPAWRILLSHSPDQIGWARQRGFHLMLAGHTHGGHIQLPGIGPIACPSRYGVEYASGLFDEPPTVMHVSRGVSGLDPVRFQCPPEITRLVLRCAAAVPARGGSRFAIPALQ